MKSALAVAAATIVGAFGAWVFIRHGSLGWWIVGALAVLALTAEITFRVLAARLTKEEACKQIGLLGFSAAASAFLVGALAATGAAYIASDVIGFTTPKGATDAQKARISAENKVLAIGLAGVAAVLTTTFIDSLDAGPVGSRLRNAYKKKIGNHNVFSENRKHHWSTAEGRRKICQLLQDE